MSHERERRVRALVPLLLLLLLAAGGAFALAADLVVMRDGRQLEGRVVSLDEHVLVVDVTGRGRERIARDEVERIELGSPAPPLRARVRVVSADDSVTLLLDGREIARPAELTEGWVDIAPLLADGANLLEGEVSNRGGTWSYRWDLDLGDRRESFSCGLKGRSGCRRGDGSGVEQGVFPAGRVWLFVSFETGEVALEIEER